MLALKETDATDTRRHHPMRCSIPEPSKLYGLPKLHKHGIPMQPIYLINQARGPYWENIGRRSWQYTLGPWKKDRGPISSQYGSEQAWLMRDLLYDWGKLWGFSTKSMLHYAENVQDKKEPDSECLACVHFTADEICVTFCLQGQTKLLNAYNKFFVLFWSVSHFVLVRHLNFNFTRTQVWDHSGQCPVQYLENIGPAIKHFDWLILLIGPLTDLLLTERDGRTGEYWPEVVAVRTERSEVRTKTTEGQYSSVRLELARLEFASFRKQKIHSLWPFTQKRSVWRNPDQDRTNQNARVCLAI